MHEFFCEVRGNFARPAEAKEAMISLGSDLEPEFEFLREPDNSFDENAIKVFYESQHIGYIGKEWAADIAPLMDFGWKPSVVQLVHWTAADKPVIQITFTDTDEDQQDLASDPAQD